MGCCKTTLIGFDGDDKIENEEVIVSYSKNSYSKNSYSLSKNSVSFSKNSFSKNSYNNNKPKNGYDYSFKKDDSNIEVIKKFHKEKSIFSKTSMNVNREKDENLKFNENKEVFLLIIIKIFEKFNLI